MKLLRKIKWSDVLIAIIGIGTFFFIREVFRVFRETSMEPSTMVGGFFTLVTAELAILWQMHNARKKREMAEKEEAKKEESEDLEIVDLEDLEAEG